MVLSNADCCCGLFYPRFVKHLIIYVALLSAVIVKASDVTATNDLESVQWQKIYDRIRVEMGITNVEEMMKVPLFRAKIVHPAFGIFWDEVPAPTLTNSSAMAGVDAFILTNGWHMHSDVFGPFVWVKNQKLIKGLPWNEIKDREFYATTHNGILYVKFTGWHYNDNGVAFNPMTNAFPRSILGFKPLAGHWYAWAQRDDGVVMTQLYEGQQVRESNSTNSGATIPQSEPLAPKGKQALP